MEIGEWSPPLALRGFYEWFSPLSLWGFHKWWEFVGYALRRSRMFEKYFVIASPLALFFPGVWQSK